MAKIDFEFAEARLLGAVVFDMLSRHISSFNEETPENVIDAYKANVQDYTAIYGEGPYSEELNKMLEPFCRHEKEEEEEKEII